MSSQTNNNANSTPHNDSVTTRKRSRSFFSCGSSSHSAGGAISVPECIVNREKVAVAVNEGHDENPAISSGLASAVAKKAFAVSIRVCDESDSPAARLGQGGLIQCPSLPTVDGTPPPAKRQKLMDAYGPAPAIKQSSSAARVSVIPVTALHNVLKDYFRQHYYEVDGKPVMASPPIGGDEGVIKLQEFDRHNDAYSSEDAIQINFPSTTNGGGFRWKYGHDITSGEVIRKKFVPQTDTNISFEAADSNFEYKIGQKVGMAVYRNYEFDFSNDEIYRNNGWDRNELSQNDILRIFGNDNSVSVYTGEITAVSTDKKAFRHDINTFRGCSGVIVFLLDENQDGLVEGKYHGKAIGVHAGAFDGITTSATDGSQSSIAKFNFAFALAGFAEQDKYTASPPSPQEADK